MTASRPKQLEALFEQVCDLTTIEREEVLDRECADETTLRLKVEELLAAMYASELSGIASPVRQLASLQSAVLPAPSRLSPGSYVDRYRVVREIGRGATGTVYEGENERIHSRVAIKVLHADRCADPCAAERFVDEARVVNIIDHANIVRVHDIGQLDSGPAYIVMEFLDGEPLGPSALDHGLQPTLKASVFARQIASALAAAHARGIIHRDLKPANVLLIRDPETLLGERVKLLDFGLAKLSAALRRPEAGVSDEHMIAGTPTYMSPEQCKGDPVSGRSDVYSLGVMLYELLVGEPPFRSCSTARLFALHREEPPPLLHEQLPRVPRALSALVAQMLRKRPYDRPSMEQVARRLDRLIHAHASGQLSSLSALPAPCLADGSGPATMLLGPRETRIMRAWPRLWRLGHHLSRHALRLLSAMRRRRGRSR